MEKQIGENLDNTMLENVTLQMQKNGKEVLAKDYIQAVKTNHKIGYEVEKMFLDFDICSARFWLSLRLKLAI